MAMHGDDAALFAELVKNRDQGTGNRDQGRGRAMKLFRPIDNSLYALIEPLCHASTSSCSVACRDSAQGLRRALSGAEIKVCLSTEISSREPPVVPMRTAKKFL
jgi:hypothetical protein